MQTEQTTDTTTPASTVSATPRVATGKKKPAKAKTARVVTVERMTVRDPATGQQVDVTSSYVPVNPAKGKGKKKPGKRKPAGKTKAAAKRTAKSKSKSKSKGKSKKAATVKPGEVDFAARAQKIAAARAANAKAGTSERVKRAFAKAMRKEAGL